MRDLLLRFINALSMKPDTHGISEAPTDLTLLEGYSITGLRVLEKLYALGQDVVARNVPGDFVECGVWKGGSAAAVACAFRHTDRRAWLFDSFEGMSKPKPVDGAFAAQYADALVGSEEKAREAMQIVRFPEGKCIIRKGWFSDTFHAKSIKFVDRADLPDRPVEPNRLVELLYWTTSDIGKAVVKRFTTSYNNGESSRSWKDLGTPRPFG